MATRKPAPEAEPSTVETAELVQSTSYTDAQLKEIQSFEDAVNLAASTYGIDYASDLLGDGFNLIKGDESKRQLIGHPMIVMEWKFVPDGDFGEFAVLRVVVPGDNGAAKKLIITDGSKGIYQQVREMTDQYGKTGGMIVHSGLRESQYPFCSTCAEAVKPSHLADNPGHTVGQKSTFYLDPTRKVLTS